MTKFRVTCLTINGEIYAKDWQEESEAKEFAMDEILKLAVDGESITMVSRKDDPAVRYFHTITAYTSGQAMLHITLQQLA